MTLLGQKKVKSPEDFAAIMAGVSTAYHVLAQFDIQDTLEKCTQADTVLPFLDPTMYQKKLADKQWDDKMELLRSALSFCQTFERMRDKYSD